MPDNTTDRYTVLDCRISISGFEQILGALKERQKEGRGGYVCFSNVHTVVTARRDDRLRDATNNSFISAADGKPLSIVGRLKGISKASHVPGPDFMQYLLEHASGSRHYFYGSTPETLHALQDKVHTAFPDAIITGAWSPPFSTKQGAADEETINRIRSANPDYIWVGLGAPKQEYWMAANHERLAPAILLGVGAAFDFVAGNKKRAPDWMQKCGLEWLYRLLDEPGRLWKRYAVTNTLFIFWVLVDALSGKWRETGTETRDD